MRVYDFNKYRNFFIANNLTGSLKDKVVNFIIKKNGEQSHQKRPIRRNKLSSIFKSESYNDCVVVLNGNCGIDSTTNFSEINDMLKGINTVLILMRGITEDPSLFLGDKICYSNLIAIPDYSILKVKGVNALCVGGGISINRIWKQKSYERTNVKTYYEEELPIFNETISEDIKNFVLKGNYVDMVISYESPSCSLKTKPESIIGSWIKEDKTLLADFMKAKRCISALYECLYENLVTPNMWVCNEVEANINNSSNINGILFTTFSKDYLFNTDCFVGLKRNSRPTLESSLDEDIDSTNEAVDLEGLWEEHNEEEHNEAVDVRLEERNTADVLGDLYRLHYGNIYPNNIVAVDFNPDEARNHTIVYNPNNPIIYNPATLQETADILNHEQ